jgi:hypothetical protein
MGAPGTILCSFGADDAARARGSNKRGGGVARVNVEDTAVVSPGSDPSILALNDALEVLGRVAPRQAKVVELRYFTD